MKKTQNIVSKIFIEYDEKYPLYNEFNNKLEELINIITKNRNLKLHSINSRIKGKKSLKEKINHKENKYNCLEDITDVAGIRIITYYADEVDIIAKLIEEEFEIDWENSIDKRAVLDADKFGYLSLHYVVKINNKRLQLTEYKNFKNCKSEIQIRSILQHAWAEIEHDSGYKNSLDIPREIKRDFYRLAGLLELGDKEFISIRGKLDLYTNNVKEEITKSPELVTIDKISLTSYMKNSKKVEKLNSKISIITKARIIKNSDLSLSGIIKELNYVGLKTIEDIDKSLDKYGDLSIKFAEKWFHGEKHEYLYESICLFYINYIILAESNSEDFIYNFLIENRIGIDDNQDDIANNVIKTYKEIS